MSHYPKKLLTLIALLKKLPGIGTKTAERFAFQLLSWPPEQLHHLAREIGSLRETIVPCAACGCLHDEGACYFCNNPQRDREVLCLVSSPKDVYAIEETHIYKGLYHVLGAQLSPLRGHLHEGLDLAPLKHRVEELKPQEVILALDSTLEGDATALYLKQEIAKWGIKTSRLAFGLPMGSPLDYVDYGTLEKALKGRF
jgi:recombination protein RecR